MFIAEVTMWKTKKTDKYVTSCWRYISAEISTSTLRDKPTACRRHSCW